MSEYGIDARTVEDDEEEVVIIEKPLKKKIMDKVLGPKWFGRVEEFVENSVTFKGQPIKEPKITCEKCGHSIDLNYEIDEGGMSLPKLRNQLNELGKWLRWGNEIEEKRQRGAFNLYEYAKEREQWRNKFDRFGKDMVSSPQSADVSIICRNCYVPLGKVTVTLRVTEPELRWPTLTWDELYNLGIPLKILVKVAYELGYSSTEALKKWVENPDLPKAENLLREFEEKFRPLQLPDYLYDDFLTKLQLLIDALPEEVKRRKMAVVEEVKKIALWINLSGFWRVVSFCCFRSTGQE